MNTLIRAVVWPSLMAVAAGLTLSGAGAADATGANPPGRIVVVQALPGASLTVDIDGRRVDQGAAVGDVLGPYALAPGSHDVRFTDPSGSVSVASTVDVTAGRSTDVVIHRPADVGGAPVLNTYRTAIKPLGPGRARVLIAHTATVAPADVRVDGVVVFHDIANGEYATADLASGPHTVALLPAGLTDHPILGPLSVDLKPGTITMVYAVGSPKDKSMNVVVHIADVATMATGAPNTIDTGAAGLVAGKKVRTFSSSSLTGDVAPSPGQTNAAPGAGLQVRPVAAVIVLLVGIGLTGRRSLAGHRR